MPAIPSANVTDLSGRNVRRRNVKDRNEPKATARRDHDSQTTVAAS